MFVTTPSFASPMPAALMQPGERSWRAVGLSVRLPWFIVTLQERQDDFAVSSDLLLSWENDLLALVSQRAGDICALQYVEPPAANAQARWRTRSIRRLWMVESEGGQAVLFEDEAGQFASQMDPMPVVRSDRRTLLLDLATRSQTGGG